MTPEQWMKLAEALRSYGRTLPYYYKGGFGAAIKIITEFAEDEIPDGLPEGWLDTAFDFNT